MRPIFALLLASLVAFPAPALSQPVQRIAVIVNDEVVSVRDLRDRIRLVLFLSGIRDTAESRRRIVNQVIRTLVDERLQLQEAARRNVSVADEEIARSLAQMEQANRMQPGSLATVLRDNGVDLNSLRAQFRARIAWSKLVHGRLARRISIGDDEVAEVLARLKANEGKETFRLAEILLPVGGTDKESAVREAARRMVQQIREGARFDTLARQFSQTATAAVGGDLGWVARSELDADVAAAVDGLAPGAVLDPIRTLSGFRILTLTDRRKAATDGSKLRLDLRQIFVPVADGAEPATVAARLEQVRAESRAIDGCDGLAPVVRRLGADAPRDLGTLGRGDLSAEIWRSVADVEDGKAASPVAVRGGIVLMVVCGRTQDRSAVPDRETPRPAAQPRGAALSPRSQKRRDHRPPHLGRDRRWVRSP